MCLISMKSFKSNIAISSLIYSDYRNNFILYSVSAVFSGVLIFFSFVLKTKKQQHNLAVVLLFGALKKIRTPDLLVRSQTLYPAELSAQMQPNFDRLNIIPQQKTKIKHYFAFFEKTFKLPVILNEVKNLSPLARSLDRLGMTKWVRPFDKLRVTSSARGDKSEGRCQTSDFRR